MPVFGPENFDAGPWVRVTDGSTEAYFWNAATAEARWTLPGNGEQTTDWHARRGGDECSFCYWNEETLEICETPPGPAITITARLATTGEALATVRVQPVFTATYLGWQICSSLSEHPPGRLQLMHGTRLLTDHDKLVDVGLRDGATVDAVWDSSYLSVPGSPWIFPGVAVDVLVHGIWRDGAVVDVVEAVCLSPDKERFQLLKTFRGNWTAVDGTKIKMKVTLQEGAALALSDGSHATMTLKEGYQLGLKFQGEDDEHLGKHNDLGQIAWDDGEVWNQDESDSSGDSQDDDDSDWEDFMPETFPLAQIVYDDHRGPGKHFEFEDMRPRLTCPAKPTEPRSNSPR